jgi:hypothetical protein
MDSSGNRNASSVRSPFSTEYASQLCDMRKGRRTREGKLGQKDKIDPGKRSSLSAYKIEVFHFPAELPPFRILFCSRLSLRRIFFPPLTRDLFN